MGQNLAMAAPARIFELRTYTSAPGRRDELEARFADHTVELFTRHGMEVVGFFLGADDDGAPNDQLVYLLAFDSREAATTAWAAFRDDPDWIAVRSRTDVDGPLAAHVESVYLVPSHFSPIA